MKGVSWKVAPSKRLRGLGTVGRQMSEEAGRGGAREEGTCTERCYLQCPQSVSVCGCVREEPGAGPRRGPEYTARGGAGLRAGQRAGPEPRPTNTVNGTLITRRGGPRICTRQLMPRPTRRNDSIEETRVRGVRRERATKARPNKEGVGPLCYRIGHTPFLPRPFLRAYAVRPSRPRPRDLDHGVRRETLLGV